MDSSMDPKSIDKMLLSFDRGRVEASRFQGERFNWTLKPLFPKRVWGLGLKFIKLCCWCVVGLGCWGFPRRRWGSFLTLHAKDEKRRKQKPENPKA